MLTKVLFVQWLVGTKSEVKVRSFRRYEEIVGKYIVPSFGNEKINKITKEKIQSFIQKLFDKDLANNSVAQIVGVLKRALKYAVRKKQIKINPAADILVKNGAKRVDAFCDRDQRKIERYILASHNPRLYGIIITLYTGLRIGELLALTWRDVDLHACTLDVNKTQSTIKVASGAEPYIGTPKTDAGRRVVAFPKELLPYLKELKAACGKYVIFSKTGNAVMVSSYQRTFAALLNKLNVRHKGFHALRHTYATRAVETGAEIKTLSEILGHSSPKTTLEQYVHSSEKQKKRLASKVGERLRM